MTSYQISPRQRCNCAKKYGTGRFYDGREVCRACNCLIVTSPAERADLAEREATIKREAKYPSGEDMANLTKEEALELMVGALTKDRTLSQSELMAVLAETGRLAYGESVRSRLCRQARNSLGIVGKAKRRKL
ncbi:MAG: hypothetical protein O2992_09635 [Gemmatimonadetes bacterium]|nr:hypothetical protein [Gemmatimonadota bacterium]